MLTLAELLILLGLHSLAAQPASRVAEPDPPSLAASGRALELTPRSPLAQDRQQAAGNLKWRDRPWLRNPYRYLELSVGELEDDGPASDADILAFRSVLPLGSVFFFQARFDNYRIQAADLSRDLTEASVGLGARASLLSWLDVVATASYLDSFGETISDTGGSRVTRFGYLTTGGLRFFAHSAFELSAFYEYYNLESGREDKGTVLSATLHATDHVGLHVRHSEIDDTKTLFMGLRFSL